MSSARNYLLLGAACITWGLLGSIIYGIHWAPIQEGRWVEWLLGGQLRWLPWIPFAFLISLVSKKLESSHWDLAPKMLAHLISATGIVLLHATYLRFMRPIPPMLLFGRSYQEVLARFHFVDYLSYQIVSLDLAVYLVIAIPATILHRHSLASKRRNEVPIAGINTSVPDTSANSDHATSNKSPIMERLLIRLADKSLVLPVASIERIEAADYYVRIYARGISYLHRESIQNLERSLPAGQFIRVHRRAIVKSADIAELVAVAESKWAVRMKSGALVEISRRRRRDIVNRISSGNRN